MVRLLAALQCTYATQCCQLQLMGDLYPNHCKGYAQGEKFNCISTLGLSCSNIERPQASGCQCFGVRQGFAELCRTRPMPGTQPEAIKWLSTAKMSASQAHPSRPIAWIGWARQKHKGVAFITRLVTKPNTEGFKK